MYLVVFILCVTYKMSSHKIPPLVAYTRLSDDSHDYYSDTISPLVYAYIYLACTT